MDASTRSTPAPRRSLTIAPARAIRGALTLPGDKSISHRYAMLGAIASGPTTIVNAAPGADVRSTIDCVAQLGAAVTRTEANTLTIAGQGASGLRESRAPLDAGNSGTTLRLLAGLVAGRPFTTTLTGDESLRRRPMQRVIDPLAAMGARIASASGLAPIVIHGGSLNAIDWRLTVASAQVKSAILFAGLSAAGTTTVRELQATRDHTERAFPVFGLTVSVNGRAISVTGDQRAVAPRSPLTVPGDPSSAAVWAAAAAALPGSAVRLEGVCLNPLRLGFVRALERMGARVRADVLEEQSGEPVGTLHIEHDTHLPTVIEPDEVPSLIDELPVLAARAALGGALEVAGAAELRVKESDRISALVTGLRALGVKAEERPDGFIVDGSSQPTGGTADAAGDHRLVMAFAIVALGSQHGGEVTGADVVSVSYPQFEDDLKKLSQ